MVDAIQDDLEQLRRRDESAALRLSILEKESILREVGRAQAMDRVSGHAAALGQDANLASGQSGDALEGYYDPDNFVDIWSYRQDNYGYQPYASTFTTRTDRLDGRNFPYWQSEPELAGFRGVSRVLCFFNETAIGALEALTNYTVSKGFQHKIQPADRMDPRKAILDEAQRVVDDFLEENGVVGDLDQEVFVRTARDGEVFATLWHQDDGHAEMRIAEPDQVTQPFAADSIEEWLHYRDAENPGLPFPSSWTFGVHTTEGDAAKRHGYFVNWTYNDQDWDYLPGGGDPCFPPSDKGQNTWCEHLKSPGPHNDRNIKRGVPDFYPVANKFELSRKLLRNLGQSAAVQAAIAWIKEMAPGVTRGDAQSTNLSQADWQYQRTSLNGSLATKNTQSIQPGTALTIPNGQKYINSPLTEQSAAAGMIGIYDAMCRSLAQRWNMPEHMMSGNAANNNYASIIEAGSPFVRAIERRQARLVGFWSKLIWRVLWWAWRSGRFGGIAWSDLRRMLSLQITPPQVDVRNGKDETERHSVMFKDGVLSPATYAAKEGLDHDQEVANGAKQQLSPAEQGSSATPATKATESAAEERSTLDPEDSAALGRPIKRIDWKEVGGKDVKRIQESAGRDDAAGRLQAASASVWEGYP